MISRQSGGITLDPNSTLARAYLVMERFKCSTLAVALRGQIVGVLSMKDVVSLANRYLEGGVRAADLTVGRAMKGSVVPVEASRDLSRVIRDMLDHETHAVLVKEGEELLGVLSRDNLLELFANLSDERGSTLKETLHSLLRFQSSR